MKLPIITTALNVLLFIVLVFKTNAPWYLYIVALLALVLTYCWGFVDGEECITYKEEINPHKNDKNAAN